MSNRRPLQRVTAKNKKTGEYTELFAIWPASEKIEGDFPRGLSLNRDVNPEDLAQYFQGDHWIDVRENESRSSGREDF